MTPTILVIDDVASNRQHFQHLLMQLGTHILQADSAEAGLNVLEHHKVDLIFLDYNMPGMNGIEFIGECRNNSSLQNVPIVMMSTDMMINEFAVSQGLAQAWVIKRATLTMVENILKTLGIW